MWVMTIGGSLAGSSALAQWLGVLASYGGGQVVIVPGRGRPMTGEDDAQHAWEFDEQAAYGTALRAMDRYGLMLAGMRPDLWPTESEQGVRQALLHAAVPIWLPARTVSRDTQLPLRRDVAADSIAAWLARRLGAARLCLIKAWQPTDEAERSVEELSQAGIVDGAFPEVVRNAPFEVCLCGPHDYELMRTALVGDMTAGVKLLI